MVERSLSMREVRGSMPRTSSQVLLFFSFSFLGFSSFVLSGPCGVYMQCCCIHHLRLLYGPISREEVEIDKHHNVAISFHNGQHKLFHSSTF